MLEAGKQLQYLIQYPYGCTEQVVSSAFPQLYSEKCGERMKIYMEAIRKIKLSAVI